MISFVSGSIWRISGCSWSGARTHSHPNPSRGQSGSPSMSKVTSARSSIAAVPGGVWLGAAEGEDGVGSGSSVAGVGSGSSVAEGASEGSPDAHAGKEGGAHQRQARGRCSGHHVLRRNGLRRWWHRASSSMERRADRLVAPSATEIVFALGLDDQLLGVTDECDWPDAPAASASLSAPAAGRNDSRPDRRVGTRRGAERRPVSAR